LLFDLSDRSVIKGFAMNNPADGFSGRLRHYVTLVIQIVPLIVFTLNLPGSSLTRVVLLLAPLFLASVGPVLELAGRRVGRTLTLTGLGAEAVGAILLITAVLIAVKGVPKLHTGDLVGVALLAGLIIVPGGLFIWNYRAGLDGRQDRAAAA
jgi:hypothetical protein